MAQQQGSSATLAEVEHAQRAWRAATKNPGHVGQRMFHKLINDMPSVRRSLEILDVRADSPDTYTLSSLSNNAKFCAHAIEFEEEVRDVLELLAKNEGFKEKCIEIGKLHKKYHIQSDHFQAMEPILVEMFASSLGIDVAHDTAKTMAKVYGAISRTTEEGLTAKE